MGNHFHLLLETPEPNLSAGMRGLLATFSQTWKSRYQPVQGDLRGLGEKACVDEQRLAGATAVHGGHPAAMSQLVNRARMDPKSLKTLKKHEKTFKSKDPVHCWH
jgi:hypothetical protein